MNLGLSLRKVGLVAGVCLASFFSIGPVHAEVNSVLWVGNSRTYVGNLPELYKALVLATDKRSIRAEMLVEGGGALQGRVADHSLERSLKADKYDYVLLQERGSVLMCAARAESRGSADCQASIRAHRRLSEITRAAGAKLGIMGTADITGHGGEVASNWLKGERWLQTEIRPDAYVPMLPAIALGKQQEPGFVWVFSDGAHQGFDGTLMMAVMSYYALEQRWPRPVALNAAYRSYSNDYGFGAEQLGSKQNLQEPIKKIKVSAEHLARIIQLAQETIKRVGGS